MSVSRSTVSSLLAMFAGLLLAAGVLSSPARAEGVEWRLEQPKPPPSDDGAQSEIPIGLGRIGDIEFWAPNKGLLITDGNGASVPPGVWVYNGEGWHELASECGATDGRIAWAGPDEFWTVSDGRPGQAANGEDILPPLEDDTLCRFAYNTATQKLEIVDSYATLAFQASSYQPMRAAACVNPTDCWFAGGPLPAPQSGAFQLHWNGSSLEAEPNTNKRVESVESIGAVEGRLDESIALPLVEQVGEEEPEEVLHPSVLQEIAPEGASTPFTELHPRSKANQILPEYVPSSPEFAFGSFPQALEGLRLSADEDSMWAAAGPVAEAPAESAPAALTVLRDSGGAWSQVLGPEKTIEAEAGGSGKAVPADLADDVVNSIAAEPGAEQDAWLALDTRNDVNNPNPTESALVVHVAANGSVSEETLPSAGERAEGVGSKGAAAKIVCPAQNDCWMATTQGWLYHLSTAEERAHPRANGEPAFSGSYLITYRPPDKGVPQEPSDTLPVDDSGLEESGPPAASQLVKATAPSPFVSVSVPLLSDVHTRLIHGSTLELSFHLAVKARVRLLAKRHTKIVASTPTRILKAGKRSLDLKLDPHRWPTKLSLKTHALAPLPTASSLSSGVETVSTSLAFPNALGISGWGPSL
jgi:hypothetical protein